MNTRTVVLWHNNGEERIYFTVNSAEINVSRSNQNWVLSLAMEGTVNVWGGRGLRAVTLKTFLPSENSPFYAGQPPEAVLAMLKRWQDSGDPVRLILSESDINDAFLLEDVSEILREGDRDVGVSITLREYKFKSALAALAGGDAPPVRTDERTPQKSYTVKKGVTLWEMACRFYGDGARWGRTGFPQRSLGPAEAAGWKGAGAVKLYVRDQMVLPVLESAVLGKNRNDAASVLTASILLAPADTCFQKLSLAVGDPVRLTDGSGDEVFLSSIHQIDRTEDAARITAYDRRAYLARNELYGLFLGSRAEIAAQVAAKLGISLGKVEADGQYKTIVSRAGQSAFSILRRAVGTGREISIQNGALTVTAQGGPAMRLAPERVLSVSSRAGIGEMVNRCVTLCWNGGIAAQTQNREDIAAYGQFQRVRILSGEAPAELLRGKTMSVRVAMLGDLALRCGGTVQADRPQWGWKEFMPSRLWNTGGKRGCLPRR